ncbi:Conserved_hypothetical protein [Hexamita inflata]|uniref:Uncharacterized protein n=1 Tax=Hexamita inflata TaxID=28002 RepID=A0AA86TVY7_9EUKA|nr:Conserved hypothetical protein [Hexamita inflata]
MNDINMFAVFGVSSSIETIQDSVLNVSIKFVIREGALICIKCQVSIQRSKLAFIANGQQLSAVLINGQNSMQIDNSTISYRFRSNYSSGLINQVSKQLLNISLFDSKITGYNYINSENNGYFICQLYVNTTILKQNVQVCTNDANAVGANSAVLTHIGVQKDECQQICEHLLYVYGLCIENITYGTRMQNYTIYCTHPFEFDGENCICETGFLLNGSICVDVVMELTELYIYADQMTQNNSMALLQQKSYLELQIQTNYSKLEQNMIQNITMVQQQTNALFNQSEQNLLQNTSNVVIMIQNNIAELNKRIFYNFSQCEEYLKTNVSALNSHLINNISVVEHELAENTTQIYNFVQQQTNQLKTDVLLVNNTLKNTTQQLKNDIIEMNSTINMLNNSLSNNEASVLSQINTLRYNISQLNLVQQQTKSDQSVLNLTLSNQITQTKSDLSSLNTSYQLFKTEAITNNSAQQNQVTEIYTQINNLKSTDTAILTSIAAANTTTIGLITTLRTDISVLNSSFTQLRTDSQNNNTAIQTNLNIIYNNLTAMSQTTTDLKSALYSWNISIRERISDEIYYREINDNQLQQKINTLTSKTDIIISDMTSNVTDINTNISQLYTRLNYNITTIKERIKDLEDTYIPIINSNTNNINSIWSDLNTLSDNVYTKEDVNYNISTVYQKLQGNISTRALKKQYCFEKFMSSNHSLFSLPFYSAVDQQCCATVDSLYGMSPIQGYRVFKYICSHWEDPIVIDGSSTTVISQMKGICGAYPCDPWVAGQCI